MNKASDINIVKNVVNHSSPSVGKFSTETLKAYEEAGILKYMFTTLVVHPENKTVKSFLKIFSFIRVKLKNRYFSEIPQKKIRLYPYKEILRLLAVKFLSLTAADTIWEWTELSFDKWVSNKLDKEVKIVHCYEHAALFTFNRAKDFGCFKILEQVSQHHSHYKNIVENQLKLYPSLRSKYIEKISFKSIKKRNERKNKEYELADLIICNSTFTMKTLIDAGINRSKIFKIPLAYPETNQQSKKNILPARFTFTCIGSISLTKGTHILINVWRKYFSDLTNAKLILAGTVSLPREYVSNLPPNIEYRGFVNKDQLNGIYGESDLLVFPTLGDGFGMVITEAMAKGVPVLTTNNSAGYDLIEDDKDGFIIDAGNEDALAQKMLWILENKSILPKMSELVIQKAKKYQWLDYRKLLIEEIETRYLEFMSKM
ncbi:glycosyltransferase family 4 protein [Pedobacter sp. Leaf170]|uniref:glycosyltransferase family 4 protein n=1 Tax=Pedobacter sp. Leaf170 TaxID=2876558 RepID=UPI001E337E1A|nr:glycosyltransferase family 4 protein [Pedobacter sp. Leaf170]